MKKLVVPALILILVSSLSQAKTIELVRGSGYQKHSVTTTQTPTKSVVARAVPKTKRRLLVTNDLSDDNNEPPGSDELDLHVSYARPRIVDKSDTLSNNNEDLSSYVTVRLAVARAKALEKYREVHNL